MEHYVSGQDDIFVCYYFILFKDKNTKVVNKIPMCIRNWLISNTYKVK